MSFRHLDQFAHEDSPLTRRAPTTRLVGTVIIALGAALLPFGAWPQIAGLGLIVAVLAVLGRIPAPAFLARLLPPLGFLVLVSGAVLFLAPGDPLARLGPLTITDAGLVRVGSVLGRGTLALGAAVILISTTSFPDIVRALRTLRLPAVVVTALGLGYRYLYILNDEVHRLRRAARSRNAGEGSASRRRVMVGVTSAALQRSFDRSERVHRAMLARGFQGHVPTLQPTPRHGRPALELLTLAALVAAITGSAYL